MSFNYEYTRKLGSRHLRWATVITSQFVIAQRLFSIRDSKVPRLPSKTKTETFIGFSLSTSIPAVHGLG